MKFKHHIIFLFLFQSFLSFSQNYKGSIKDYKTQEVVAYVNIGIPSKAWGFLSDENGNFTFKITTEKDNDTILFSLIGYQPLYITIAELKNKLSNNSIIYLNPITYDLTTVTITPDEYETKVLGSKKLDDLKCMDFAQIVQTTKDSVYEKEAKEKGIDPNSAGIELGNKMSIKIKTGQRTFLDKVQFKVCLQPQDTVIYRINVYTEGKTLSKVATPIGMVKEKELTNVLKEPIVVKCIGQTGVQTIDASAQNIELKEDFIIALECIYTSNKKMEIGADPSIFGSTDFFMRLSIMESWIKVPLIDITFISATVSQKKIPGLWQRLFH